MTEYVGYIQNNLLLFLLLYDHHNNPLPMQWANLHQLGAMAKTQDTHRMVCVQYNCLEFSL